ncbi:amino acid ABC transporter permease [Desulfovermiculus halophilus]|jgi:polar amino acid transport system permease protein|uniref:amino acid ABC transporter permease n=1 Tax=Desulfovermiculus halophilus TaxID=339722 RepID=UPI0005572B21|nr:amino acid ABC transporter permease [Desulfovermiculus halophilus]
MTIPFFQNTARPWEPWWSIGRYLLLVGVIIWLAGRGAENLGYNWQWYRLDDAVLWFQDGRPRAGPLLIGLAMTLKISGAALMVSLVLGLATALLRLLPSAVGRLLARVYLELVRNIPLLILIFFIYFVLGPLFGLGRFASAVLALSLFEGAYVSEIFRGGIVSIHRGQWEAAYSLGLSTWDMYARVVLPQALRRIIPPLTGQAVSLVKDSALVSTISIYDLTMQGQALVAETFLAFEVWFTVAGMYLVLTISLSLAARALERRLAVRYAG